MVDFLQSSLERDYMNAVETAGNIEVVREVIKRHFPLFAETYNSTFLVDHSAHAAERYVNLMRSSIPCLEKNEWFFLLEAFWSTYTIFTGHHLMDFVNILIMEVYDTCDDGTYENEELVYSEKLINKIKSFTKVEAMAVFHVIEYVKGHPEMTTEEALRAAGVSF
jgi:hypothetical protein